MKRKRESKRMSQYKGIFIICGHATTHLLDNSTSSQKLERKREDGRNGKDTEAKELGGRGEENERGGKEREERGREGVKEGR